MPLSAKIKPLSNPKRYLKLQPSYDFLQIMVFKTKMAWLSLLCYYIWDMVQLQGRFT